MADRWRMTLEGHTLDSDELTSGEWESIFVRVQMGGMRHGELEIHPLHCPTCRNSIAMVLLEVRTGIDMVTAARVVGAMPRAALLDAVQPPDLPDVSVAVVQPDGTRREVPGTAVGTRPADAEPGVPIGGFESDAVDDTD